MWSSCPLITVSTRRRGAPDTHVETRVAETLAGQREQSAEPKWLERAAAMTEASLGVSTCWAHPFPAGEPPSAWGGGGGQRHCHLAVGMVPIRGSAPRYIQLSRRQKLRSTSAMKKKGMRGSQKDANAHDQGKWI